MWPHVTTKNPFPGMNPFFEQRWRDAHTRLIAYLCDALQERLPADLVAGAEEETVTIAAGEPAALYRPDIQVREPWTLKEPAASAMAAHPPAMPATEPIRVLLVRASACHSRSIAAKRYRPGAGSPTSD